MAGNRVSADSTDETDLDVDRHGEHGTAIEVPEGTAGEATDDQLDRVESGDEDGALGPGHRDRGLS